MAKYQVREGLTPGSKAAAMLPGDLGGGVYNTEEWITESGNWVAPLTGWYKIKLIGGGHGGKAYLGSLVSGSGGRVHEFLMYLLKNTSIPVIIGAGGIAQVHASPAEDTLASVGGSTTFGSYSSDSGPLSASWNTLGASGTTQINVGFAGGGFGGGQPHSGSQNGSYYGAGGGTWVSLIDHNYSAGNGYSGAICIRYYDPTKF